MARDSGPGVDPIVHWASSPPAVGRVGRPPGRATLFNVVPSLAGAGGVFTGSASRRAPARALDYSWIDPESVNLKHPLNRPRPRPPPRPG